MIQEIARIGRKRSVAAMGRGWLMGSTALAVLATAMPLLVAPAVASEQTEQVAQASEAIGFKIPPQALDAAVTAFGRQSGWQISVDQATLSGRTSPGVTGRMAAPKALNQLLGGTGVTWRITDAKTVVLENSNAAGAMELGPVTVEAASPLPAQAQIGNLPPEYAGGQVARGAKLGVLGNRDIMDTPFNITAYTADVMQNQQARTVADVLENDPSVRFTTPTGHAMEWFKIRGVEVSYDSITMNGMSAMAPYGHIPVEFLERVEVLKGPSALMNGMGIQRTVGGMINLVPKRAGDTPVLEFTGDFTSDSRLGGHVDFGRRFGTDGRVGVRVNGVKRDGDTGVDGQSKDSVFGALALDYRGEDVRLSLDTYHSNERFENGSPMTVVLANGVTAIPGAPDSGANAFRGTYGEQTNTAAVVRGEYDVTKDVTAYASVGKMLSRMEGFITSTHLRNVTAQGNTANTFTYSRRDTTDTLSAEGGVRARFSTGPVGHEMVLGASSVELDNGTAGNSSASFASNIYNPVTPLLAVTPDEALRDNWAQMTSLALADTLSFAKDRVLLTLGARQQGVKYKTFATSGAETSNYDEGKLTPAVGLVVKPVESVSLYGNYVEALTRGARVTTPGRTNFGQVFAPYVSKQKEVGVKWDAGRFTNTVSLFEIMMKHNLIVTANTETPFEQRNRGIEWNMFGEIADGTRLLGGVTYTKAKMMDTAGGTTDGNTPFGTPAWLANIGAEWDAPWAPGLTLEGRIVYTGEQYVNNTNTLKLTDWTRFDAGARYAVPVEGRDITVRGYITNLLDTNYWSGAFSDGVLMQNEGRTYMLSATVGF